MKKNKIILNRKKKSCLLFVNFDQENLIVGKYLEKVINSRVTSVHGKKSLNFLHGFNKTNTWELTRYIKKFLKMFKGI